MSYRKHQLQDPIGEVKRNILEFSNACLMRDTMKTAFGAFHWPQGRQT